MAPVIRELEKHRDWAESIVLSTGQHREMLDQVLELFGTQPDLHLDLMQTDQSLSQLTASLFQDLDRTFSHVKPDWVLAQGDTTTVLVAGLVSFYHRIKFGHVEAGLRTGDNWQPFPEEINRRVVDMFAELMFAPTALSRQQLLSEGRRDSQIVMSGNTVIDALLTISDMPYDWSSGPLVGIPRDKKFVLITAHRRESFGGPFEEMCLAIRDLAINHARDSVHLIFPVHLNPNVRRPVNRILAGVSNISLLPPLDYCSLVHLMKRCTLILTDSGGIQEEAPSLGIPVLVMRDMTERPEGIHAGAVKLVGTSRATIVDEASRLLSDPGAHQAMAMATNPYGDGKAAQRIVAALLTHQKQ